jgi:prepilin-type N-terminal cleavage/methylation domain-containing protein
VKNNMQKLTHLLPDKRPPSTVRGSHDRQQAGFTIIELLVATLVFSMVLILIAVGVLEFNHAYYSGITQTGTQNTARSILEQVSQDIQFSGSQITSPISNGGSDPEQGFCIGSDRYSYRIGWELVSSGPVVSKHQTLHALVKDSPGICSGMRAQDFTKPLAGGSTELLSPFMRLSKLSVSTVPGTSNLYKVDVRVVYGDDDLLTTPVTANNVACKSGSGDQFCAISELSTVVQQRIQ